MIAVIAARTDLSRGATSSRTSALLTFCNCDMQALCISKPQFLLMLVVFLGYRSAMAGLGPAAVDHDTKPGDWIILGQTLT